MNLINNLKKIIKKIIFRGNKYECPFCHYKSNSLFPIGLNNIKINELNIIGAGRRNAGCHNCGSTDRERLVYIYLTQILKIQEKKYLRILHVAPEKNIKQFINEQKFETYICGDKFDVGYSYDNDVENIDIVKLKFDNNCFDLIICNHVLEHVCEDQIAIREIYRVLKPDGIAILQVPISYKLEKTYEDFKMNTPALKLEHFGQEDHVRVYGIDFIERLSKNGFIVSRVNISSAFSNYGLNPSEDLFLCKKTIT